mmetsp:Transcript_3103/g.7206  ORF Transcript_3103/g.7206 Transcript_3103/m.7206 type:complete len:176 (-) Transcript_3103:147-674(-)
MVVLLHATSFAAEVCIKNGSQCNPNNDILFQVKQGMENERLEAASSTRKFKVAHERTAQQIRVAFRQFRDALHEYDAARASLSLPDESSMSTGKNLQKEFENANRRVDFTYSLASDLFAQTCGKLRNSDMKCAMKMKFMTQQKFARMPLPTCAVGVTTPFDDKTIRAESMAADWL